MHTHYHYSVVFSFVGGLYFFLRTSLNALVKCLRVTVFLAYKSVCRLLNKREKKHDEEKLILAVAESNDVHLEDKKGKMNSVPIPRVSADPRVSLLASLPADYHSINQKTSKQDVM